MLPQHYSRSRHDNISKPKRPKILKTFRNLATYSINNFCEALLNNSYELNNITLTDDVDRQVNILNTVFHSCLNQVAPLISKYISRPNAPWINIKIKDNMTLRDSLQHKLKTDRNNIQLHSQYEEEKRRVKDKLHEAKKIYSNVKFHES